MTRITSAQNLPLRNRAGADDWIHIVPKGELPNPEANVVQVLDEQALDSILRNLNADKQRLGDKWSGLYGGREHFIYNAEQDGAALAWFKEFEKREDGLWGRAEFTDLGENAIKNGQYKWTSFASDVRDTQKLGGNRVRILKIDTIGFTNQPNGRELLTPMSNRNGASAPATGCAVRLDCHQAGAEIHRLTNRLQQERKWTFDQAWNHVRATKPFLYAILQKPVAQSILLTNRVPGMTDGQLLSVVAEVQEAVRERMFRQFDEDGDSPQLRIARGGTAVHDRDPFLAELHKQMDEHGGDFDAAWLEIQKEDPELFANFVIRTPEALKVKGVIPALGMTRHSEALNR